MPLTQKAKNPDMSYSMTYPELQKAAANSIKPRPIKIKPVGRSSVAQLLPSPADVPSPM
jgi:hypothetical protein